MQSPNRDWHKPSLHFSSGCSFSLSALTEARLTKITTGLRGLELDDYNCKPSQLSLKRKKDKRKGQKEREGCGLVGENSGDILTNILLCERFAAVG